MLNDLATNVLFLTLGIINFLYSPQDLSPGLLMGFRMSRFDKYASALLLRHLYMMVSSLHLIL